MAFAIVQKRCGDCGEIKSAAEFYLDDHKSDGLAWNCKACVQRYGRDYRKQRRKNPEFLTKDRERVNREARERRLNDPEWRDKKNAYRKAHYEANREKYYAYLSKRKAKKAGGGGSHSAEAWRQMLDLFGHKCLCCSKTQNLTRDHVQPLSLGGSDDIANLQVLCRRCNKSKYTRRTDFRSREKVVLAELNEVGQVLFEGGAVEAMRKHAPASGYTGVQFAPKGKRPTKPWKARIQVDGKIISLGGHATAREAALAYNEASRRFFGKSAYVNDVD